MTRAQHSASYYAATANWQSDYPQLSGGEAADVCVVGGGFTGIACALTLAQRGYSVAVVEARRVGWGATGRNGGQLIHGFSSDEKLAARLGDDCVAMLWELGWRGHAIIRQWVEEYGIDCDLRNGFLEVAAKPGHMRLLERQYRQFEAHAHAGEFRLLDRAGVREMLGTDAYAGGFVTMANGHLHPLNLCLGEARAAQKLGVRIFEHSPVTRIEHGARPRAHTARGFVEAGSVVLAGNAYHRLEPRRLSGLTFPAGSYIIATEPLPAGTRQEINPRQLAVCDSNEIVDYFRLSGDGRLLYGGRCNYSGRDPASIQAAILPRMLKVYPQLRGVKVDYEWGGKIGIVLNRIPMLGRIRGNVYYAQGYSGHGVNVAHIFGELVAEAIGGTLERFDLFAGIRHRRIPGGQWLGNQIIALGMLYFRLKDRLA
jgi:glycine/D-amino acid oxidase-like deaminating enzyme